MEMKESELKLFVASYEIGESKPQSICLRIDLSVYVPGKKLTGMGILTRTKKTFLTAETKLEGDFTYISLMPQDCHILVTATGYPVETWPAYSGIGPEHLPNVELRMVLTDNGKSGFANYRYSDIDGWKEVINAPVKSIAPMSVNDL